jgi:hypothetical protein
MNWTDERVEKLKKLWAEGLSASQIAAQLGGVSRNAVIGKVHRLSLPGRAKAGGTANAAANAEAQHIGAARAELRLSRHHPHRYPPAGRDDAEGRDRDRNGRGNAIRPERQRGRADFPPPRPDGTHRAHLQVAGRRSAEG